MSENATSPTNSAPLTKTARQQKIIDLITRKSVHSQIDLAENLATMGITVTQATLSRDLAEVGAVKIRSTAGSVYAVPGEGGDRSLQQSTGDSLDAKLPTTARRAPRLRSGSEGHGRSAHPARSRPIFGLGDRPLLDDRDLRHHRRRRHCPRHCRLHSRGTSLGGDVPRIRGRRPQRGLKPETMTTNDDEKTGDVKATTVGKDLL